MNNRIHICAEPAVTRYEPDEPLFVSCCHTMRPASVCVIKRHRYGAIIWCAPGHGCQDPQVVAAKRARVFANRSAGQKARWARQKNSPGDGLDGGE